MRARRNSPSVRAVSRELRELYGRVQAKDYLGNPLDELIWIILSQSTTTTNTERAYAALRKRFPTWERVLAAPRASIAASIRHGGLANVKARYIRNALRAIREREGRLSLACLLRMTDEQALGYLMSIPGVGVKTASCVLMFALGRPVFAVDTHVYRLTRRIGWLARNVPIHRAGEVLGPAIPDELVLPLHLYLIWHGRAVCLARRPRCPACAIRRLCRHQRGICAR